MTREVDLVSYLPPFLAEFKEIAVTLEAENPEFVLVWNAAERVLSNEFIETADEYGISRFEKILNILPSTEDTLESRRARVQARWFNTIPYTMKSFLAKLIALCGDSDFTVTKEYQNYKVKILTNLELFGQVEELERIIDSMIPCNMIVISLNEIPCGAAGFAFVAGGVCSVEHFFITNDEQTQQTISSGAIFGGGTVHTAHYFITNDSKENVAVPSICKPPLETETPIRLQVRRIFSTPGQPFLWVTLPVLLPMQTTFSLFPIVGKKTFGVTFGVGLTA